MKRRVLGETQQEPEMTNVETKAQNNQTWRKSWNGDSFKKQLLRNEK